ncbi:TIGR03943 family protein [soil metagenome]
MNRETENMLLLLVGISGVLIVVTGTYTRYVKATSLPWLLAGSVVVVVLAAAAILVDIRRGGAPPEQHSHRAPVLWLLAVPVVMLIFVNPPAIGAGAADTAAAAASTTTSRHPFPPLPPGPAPEVSLPDVLIRSAQDSAGTLDNRLITVSGFVMHRAGRVELGRVVITCCAADATLARLPLAGPAAAEAARFPDDTWLRVEGQVSPGPTLDIRTVTRIDAPTNTYA